MPVQRTVTAVRGASPSRQFTPGQVSEFMTRMDALVGEVRDLVAQLDAVQALMHEQSSVSHGSSSVLAPSPAPVSRADEIIPSNVIALPVRVTADPRPFQVGQLNPDELEIVFYAIGLPDRPADGMPSLDDLIAAVTAKVEQIGLDAVQHLAAEVFGAARAGDPHPRVNLMPSLAGRESARFWAGRMADQLRARAGNLTFGERFRLAGQVAA
jgi:hypothetical protein